MAMQVLHKDFFSFISLLVADPVVQGCLGVSGQVLRLPLQLRLRKLKSKPSIKLLLMDCISIGLGKYLANIKFELIPLGLILTRVSESKI